MRGALPNLPSCRPGQWDHRQQLLGTFLGWKSQYLPLEASRWTDPSRRALAYGELWNLGMSSSL